MVLIRIRDHVAGASSYEDGDIIYNIIKNSLEAQEAVEISFDGIASVPSAFVNAAFVRLLESISFEELKEKIKFINSTRSINELLRSRLEFVARNG